MELRDTMNTKGKKRMSNIELLRILAMMMVVMLHYLGKGGVLPDLTRDMEINGYAAWIMEILSIVAVNVYVLISGYFLVETGFKCKRLVGLLCQILFYSLLVPVVLLLTGVLHPEELSLNQLLQYILPVQKEHYWFVTAYVAMYLFSPVLGTAVKHMEKKQLQIVIAGLLLFFSVSKSILPVRLDMDTLGYDSIWFLCVFLIAAYIRLYGIPFFKNAKRGILGYLAGCTGILVILFAGHFVYLKTGQLELFLETIYGYNHILNIFAAVSLFYAFYHLRIPEGVLSRLICRVGPYTFGVLLLHEHVEMRYRWPVWLNVNAGGNVVFFVLRSIGSVLVVFLVGILVDMVRGFLFNLAAYVFREGVIWRR